MSDMPGNPYAAVSTATLALAYETRTANLIAYANASDDETADVLWGHITTRLGLGDEQ